MPAHFLFENGGETVALVPTRYPGSESSPDGQVLLARKTLWQEAGADSHHGLGQRVIVTDAEEVPLLQIRSIAIGPAADAAAGGVASHG
jgi:type VI secretion system protein ImpE